MGAVDVEPTRSVPINSRTSSTKVQTDEQIRDFIAHTSWAGSCNEVSVGLAEVPPIEIEQLEEGEISTKSNLKQSSKGELQKNSLTRLKKKSKSTKSGGYKLKMATGSTHEPSSSKNRLGAVHDQISLCEMKKAARLKASKIGSAKSSAGQSLVRLSGIAGTSRMRGRLQRALHLRVKLTTIIKV